MLHLVRIVAAAGITAIALFAALLLQTDPFKPDAKLAEQPPQLPASRFIVAPYLQHATQTGMTVMWETSVAGPSVVEYGTEGKLTEKATGPAATIHEIKLEKLLPATNYAYRVTTTPPDGDPIVGPLLTFQTAVGPDDAYSFVLVGDTQRNPIITGKVAQKMFLRRPSFAIHLGDVVDSGPTDKQWIEDLFGPCRELFGHVAVFPCIGNHERNHPNYYKYFSLPAPEYHYKFTYGNAEFFVVDTNKKITPESDQYKWLDSELGRSIATWKFCYHHHPSRSSDEDDYGDTWKGKPSKLGDANPIALMPLYDKHGVDVVFNGHVHAYERTWPIRAGKVDRGKGTVYITSGGGGGKLEGFSPHPTWFKAMVRTDFHYCYVAIQGKKLSLKAFDHEDRLFDFVDIDK
ncbi:MAG: metallophosphoesterase family protein [Planctomycetes bacterium]|nr:metallophosphoesterase family protein [Planctomycetota bacterium]